MRVPVIIHRRLLLPVIALSSGLCIAACLRNAPTTDEPAHLLAGARILCDGRFDLYKVNPPLAHLPQGIPFLATGVRVDWQDIDSGEKKRPEWLVGARFFHHHFATAVRFLRIARSLMLPFWLLSILLVYRWAAVRDGDRAGLAAAIIWGFNPVALTSAASLSSDMAATSMILAAGFFITKSIGDPISTWDSFLAGILSSAAILCKSSALVLSPYFCLMLFTASGFCSRTRLRSIIVFHLAVLLGINLGYGFQATGFTTSEIALSSQSLKWLNSVPWLPIPLPASFVEGIDLQLQDFQVGMVSYAAGVTSNRGWWWWYLYSSIIKCPAGTFLLIVGTGVAALVRVIVHGIRRGWHHTIRVLLNRAKNDAGLILPPLAVLLLVSAHTGFTEYIRYVLPAYPFLAILLAGSVTYSAVGTGLLRVIVWGLIIWPVVTVMWMLPYTHSFSNELFGGASKGHHYLVGASIESGEDLFELRDWIRQHARDAPLFVSRRGGLAPEIAGIKCERMPSSGPGKQLELEKGLYIVSVDYLQLAGSPYGYVRDMRKIGQVGYSNWIFQLEENEVRICDSIEPDGAQP